MTVITTQQKLKATIQARNARLVVLISSDEPYKQLEQDINRYTQSLRRSGKTPVGYKWAIKSCGMLNLPKSCMGTLRTMRIPNIKVCGKSRQ